MALRFGLLQIRTSLVHGARTFHTIPPQLVRTKPLQTASASSAFKPTEVVTANPERTRFKAPVRRIVPKKKARPAPNDYLHAWVKDFRTGENVGLVEVRQLIFGEPIRRDILHRVVVWYLASLRQGTHSTKGRNEVRGSTRKIVPQKGTGGARHGTIRAPQFRHGGIAHGPKPRSHAFKLNKKFRVLGLRVALSAKYAQADGLWIVEDETLPNIPKTKVMVQIIARHKWKTTHTLIVAPSPLDKGLVLASRNIPLVKVVEVKDLTVYDIVRSHRLILAKSTLAELDKIRFNKLLTPPSYEAPVHPLLKAASDAAIASAQVATA